jgi:ABC-2 type transport system permease protein
VSGLGLALRQIKYENRSFWRNAAAAFFTVIFPLMFLIIFNLVFGDEEREVPGGTVDMSTFYVPAIAALSVISACFTNIAITTSFQRDAGILKRKRGTPLPPWAYLFGRIVHSTLLAFGLVTLVTLVGRFLYGVDIPDNTLPAAIVTVLVGAACFSSLGLAVTGMIRDAEAAPPTTNAIVLPLLFISDVFIPLDEAPTWLEPVASVFPILHFSRALQTAFNPFQEGAGFEWDRLAVMAIWAVVGALLSVRFFRWEPQG